MIKLTSSGQFKKTKKYLEKIKRVDKFKILDRYGKLGVQALSSVTPVRTGKTAASWDYEIKEQSGSFSITWTNSNKASDGTPIVLLLQLGHGTRSGSYVAGRDFINPAIEPIMEKLAKEVWEEVTNHE